MGRIECLLMCLQTGETALYLAALKDYVKIVKMLINHGAAVDLGRDEVSYFFYYMLRGQVLRML